MFTNTIVHNLDNVIKHIDKDLNNLQNDIIKILKINNNEYKEKKKTSKKKEDKKKEEPIIQNTLSGASGPVLVPAHGHGSLSGESGSFKVKKNIVDTINPFED